MNHFKPYNDINGYRRGDEMILLLARTITAHADPRRDFVGHVGGDDFVVLFQSDDWQQRCDAIVSGFTAAAAERYAAEARAAGHVLAEDRYGVQREHPLTTLSIGAVPLAGQVAQAEEVASAAAAAKRQGKARGIGVYLLDWASLASTSTG